MDTDAVFEYVQERFGYSRKMLISKVGEKEVCLARHVAAYLLVNVVGMSYPVAGRVFHRHHSTIFHSCQVVEDKITDKTLAFGFPIEVTHVERKKIRRVDKTLSDGFYMIQTKIRRCLEKHPYATMKGLIELAERLDVKENRKD